MLLSTHTVQDLPLHTVLRVNVTCEMFGFCCFCCFYGMFVFYTVCSDHHICLLSPRLPNAFALNSTHSMAAAGSAAEGISSPVETDTLKIEEVQAPATGTRKAKVLYDYDAADSSELSLLADEVRFHHQTAASGSNKNHCPLATLGGPPLLQNFVNKLELL